jgi:two-component system, sensor histidine kinase PdtaS
MNQFKKWPAIRIALIYMVVGGIWIFFSDRHLKFLFPSFVDYQYYQTIKGWFFVLGTGALIFYLLNREFAKKDKIEAELQRNLEEKKILLNEIHHRVKNNLNSIISFLYIQKENFTDKELTEQFSIAINRIYSMALIHEQLYKSSSFDSIDIRFLVPELINNIKNIDSEATGNVEFKIEIGDVFLNINKAIPCAIIINEVVTNSIKHAFPANTSGTILIKMHKVSGQYHLTISDSGVGLPDGWNAQVGKGLGLTLISSLVKQLYGSLEISVINGISYDITFDA